MFLKILSLSKKFLFAGLFLGLVIWLFIFNFSFVFKSQIVGEVQKIESVGNQAVITNNEPLNPQVFSFSVAIKDLSTNEIHMASSEDRKWGAVQPGNCVISAFFPYEPWRISKGMTDRNARLLQNFVSCADLPDTSGIWNKIKFFFLLY